MNEQQLLRQRDVAEILAVSTRTVARLIASGELPSVKFGEKKTSVRRVHPEALRLFIERHSS